MHKTQAFVETRGDRTALVVVAGEDLFGTSFCIHLDHEGGGFQKHPVCHHMFFKDAMHEAEQFLNHDPEVEAADARLVS